MTPHTSSSIRVVPATDHAVNGVGKYRYIAMLAEGGMAEVYLAVTQNAGFEKLVVIKQFRQSLAEDPSFVTMFMDEARLAARLNHPNVVQTLEVGTDKTSGLHFMAMEFLEGVAYVRLARTKDRVPPLGIHIRILIDVLRGLHYAHELRDFDGRPLDVVHRDVSPQNVMLTFAGGVKVLDFGIAKAALAVEQRPDDLKGKIEYMAPEQARGDRIDRRADLFSVGVMLHEAITRRRLFRKGDDKMQMLTNGQLPRVLDVFPAAPQRLAEICDRAMADDPGARYPTADFFADELEQWLVSTGQHVTARDVGSFIADRYASTRTKINTAVEAQLKIFRSIRDDAPDTIPLSKLAFNETNDILDLPPLLAGANEPPSEPTIALAQPVVDPPSEPTIALRIPPSSKSPITQAFAAPTPAAGVPPVRPAAGSSSAISLEALLQQAAPPQAFPSGPPQGFPPPVVTGPPPPISHMPVPLPLPSFPPSSSTSATVRRKPDNKPVLIIAAVALSAVMMIGAVVAVATRKPKVASTRSTASASAATAIVAPPAKSSAAPSAEAAPPAAPAGASAEIDFTIKASPADAKILLDGKPLSGNPATGKRPQDTAMHTLKIEAPGHETREEQVSFERSLMVSIELKTSSAAAIHDPPKPSQTRGAWHPTPRPPRARPAASGKLDSENPYQ